MAVGDVKSDLQAITSGARLDINPAAGEEWVIHNIFREDAITIEFYDGTDTIAFESLTGNGVYAKYQFHVKNGAERIRVKNDAATTKKIGYDGVQTK